MGIKGKKRGKEKKKVKPLEGYEKSGRRTGRSQIPKSLGSDLPTHPSLSPRQLPDVMQRLDERDEEKGLSESLCQTDMNNSDANDSAQHVLPCLVSLPCPILSINHTHPLWARCI